MPNIVVSPLGVDWAVMAAAEILKAVGEILSERPVCRLMLTGGNTARSLYRTWAASGVMNNKPIEYFFGDERCVPPEHPESNFGLAKAVLFRDAIPDKAVVNRMEGENHDHDKAARKYAELLRAPMDIVLLGMGLDGHIASLFPSRISGIQHGRRVVAVSGPVEPRERITITPDIIREARNVFLLATGAEKGKVLRSALGGPANPDSLPVSLLTERTWLLDSVAASALGVDAAESELHSKLRNG